MTSPTSNQPRVASVALPFAYPLDEFYALANRELPPIEQIPAESVPEPYRRLLVHQDDMTPTLEKFHGDRVHLKVISRQTRGDYYFREVVLFTENSQTPVEFGAIKINLTLFPALARHHILEEKEPLGTILGQDHIVHSSRPKAYLRLAPDAFMREALALSADKLLLYGRRNTLFDHQQRSLAEIVEILPPEKAAR
jgi:chorismate-pyruvate lyase